MRITRFLPIGILSALAVGAPARGDDGVATGVGNRFSQTSTPLTNDKGALEWVFTHRFNEDARDAGGAGLGGLDSGAAIGFGIDYVFVPNVAFQVYRVNNYADYEFALKGTILRPTASLPLALGLRGGLDWRTAAYAPKTTSWFGQALLSYTIANRVTLAAAPSYAEDTMYQQDVFNVPLVLQVKITKSIAVIGEFVPKKNDLPNATYQWSVAVEKQIFHHRFAVWIGNTQATTVDQYIGGDYGGGITDKNLKIGFNLSRAWDLFPAAK
ncbi:MAG: DUF5777 family beta-barrel protein [Acidobacteriota bacterium]